MAGHQPLQIIQSSHDLLGIGVRIKSEQPLLQRGQPAINGLNGLLDQLLGTFRLYEHSKGAKLSPVPLEPLFRQAGQENEQAALQQGIGTANELLGTWAVAANQGQGSLSAAHRRLRDEQQATVRELQKLNEALRVKNTERRRADESVRRTEQELRLIVDNIPVLAARYRPDGTMDFRNKSWRDYTGLSQDNLEGHRWGAALHPDDLALVEREWRSHIATGEPFDLEQRLRRADGEYRWHWVRRVPLHDDSGNVIKW